MVYIGVIWRATPVTHVSSLMSLDPVRPVFIVVVIFGKPLGH